MRIHKRHSDEELLKRLRDEAPEILEAEISLDLDEAVKALIDADPMRTAPKDRKKTRIKKRSKAKR